MFRRHVNFVFPSDTRILFLIPTLYFLYMLLGAIWAAPPSPSPMESHPSPSGSQAVFIILMPFLLVTLLVVTMREGVMIDREKRRIKAYLDILGIRFKPWQPLPKNIRLILVRNEERFGTNYGWMPTGNRISKFTYQAKLIIGNYEDKIVVAKSRRLKIAAEKGRTVADFLNIPLEDFTDR